MPFDGTPELDIATINRIVLAARADGRLICDNPKTIQSNAFWHKTGGVTYVCAVGAVDQALGHPHSPFGAFTQHLNALMDAHDRLFRARTSRHKDRIARREAEFDALLART